MSNRCFINDTVCEYANNNGFCCVSACLKNKLCESTIQEEKEHEGTFDDPLPQPKYEPPKIMLL